MAVDWNLNRTIRLEEVTVRRLASALGEDDTGTGDEVFERIKSKMEGIAVAAVNEYCGHLSGERPLATIGALREDRLMLLVEHLYGGDLPRATALEDLFQLTSGEATGLLRRTKARRRFDLAERMRVAARTALDTADDAGDEKQRIRASEQVVEHLNGILERQAVETALIEADGTANGMWLVTDTAFEALDEAV